MRYKMNRNQRRYGRISRVEKVQPPLANPIEAGLEEVFPPKGRRVQANLDERSMTNRCCYVSPDLKDFGQLTDDTTILTPSEQYQKILLDQYGFDPIMPENVTHLKELKRVLCGGCKVENSSQYANNDCSPYLSPYIETLDEAAWQNVDNTDDIEKLLRSEDKADPVSLKKLPRSVHITDEPRVKLIAERYSRLKKDNIELRRLDEKVLCVEYDIYDDSSTGDMSRPVQRMRAFFSVKPVHQDSSDGDEIPKPELSPTFNQFSIADEDLLKLTDREIEIIDGKIHENRPYLEDLKRILKRQQIIETKRKKSSLDLRCLYEMAKTQQPILEGGYSNANFLSKAELQEMKDLILARSVPSGEGIARKRLKCEKGMERQGSVISESIVAVLLRDKMGNI